MVGEINHVLLTRFNLPSAGPEDAIRSREGWLERRITLFERYCLPSVISQTSRQFHWIVYFDPQSPSWLRCRIDEHVTHGAYAPIFRSTVSNTDLVGDITKVTGRTHTRLMTTNLDNDDGLALNFIERLQAAGPRSGMAAIYLARGLVKCDTRIYLRQDRHNAFCSVAEEWESPATCWSDWHTLLGRRMPVLELYGEPGWLQVVHGSNVSNRVRGRLSSPSEYARLFTGLIDDVAEPSHVQMAEDLLVAQPRRVVRDASRVLVKAVVMQLAGKEGLDRAKSVLRQVRAKTGGAPEGLPSPDNRSFS